jgi:hypothetical protein
MKKKSQEIGEFIAAMYSDDPREIALVSDMEEAFIGIANLPSDNSVTVAIYDRDKCIDLVAKDMPLEEAEEHFTRNIEGSYAGKPGPIFVTPIKQA